MAIRSFKPTSPGRRFMTVSDFSEVTKGAKPEKTLLEPLPRSGGRNVNGRMTTRHRGGGHKRRYRIIDFKRRKDGVPARVAADRVRPEPVGPHRAAPLRGRRQGLHPAPRPACGSGTRSSPGPRPTSRSVTACRCRPSRRGPRSTPSSCAPVRARSSSARRAAARSSWPRRAARRCCGCPRARYGAFRRTAGRPSARSRTPRTRTSPAARPGARAGVAAGRRCAARP